MPFWHRGSPNSAGFGSVIPVPQEKEEVGRKKGGKKWNEELRNVMKDMERDVRGGEMKGALLCLARSHTLLALPLFAGVCCDGLVLYSVMKIPCLSK